MHFLPFDATPTTLVHRARPSKSSPTTAMVLHLLHGSGGGDNGGGAIEKKKWGPH